jgi:hypothetical protein
VFAATLFQTTLAFAESPAVAGADSQSKPTGAVEAAPPTAPRPQQIEAMVEPIKRVAPRMPESKVKVAPSQAKSAPKGCDHKSKSNKSNDACAATTNDRKADAAGAKTASKTTRKASSTATASKKR